jgi:hypothetical protein
MSTTNTWRLAAALGLAAAVTACGGASDPPKADGPTASSDPKEKYPDPRWPSYFKPPTNVEDLMPAARSLVRNRSGLQGNGLGILNAGDQVLIVASSDADPMVMEAVKRALEERKITPHIKFSHEMVGRTREDAERMQKWNREVRSNEHAGIYQASSWITGQFPNPDQPKAWLKQRRPDLYKELFPEEADASRMAEIKRQREIQSKSRETMGNAIKKFLTDNPKVRGVFWGSGGSTGLRRAVYPMQEKFLGTFVNDNIYALQSQMTTYPGDLWQLAEEQLMEPITYAAGLEITDPEGTNLKSELTEDMANRWAQGAYQRGHLYMFPNQATGRFGYSFVDYPAFNPKWLAREPIARIEGIVAGTQGHGGFFPRWEVVFKNGFIAEVRGGGAQGEALREFINYPGLNDLVYPYHTTPGYWYLYEIAFGSHPKAFRDPISLNEDGNTSPERVRSGVIHWGLGIRLWHDPDAPTESKKWQEFTEKHNVPKDHGWHTHTYFTTYRVKLRNADKWVSLLDKGRMTSLDDPEVRALASRYGDPDYLLAEDWIPDVPGINAPGDYMRDYAPNPGKIAIQTMTDAMKGSYKHYYPPAGTKMTVAPGAKPASAGPGGGQ